MVVDGVVVFASSVESYGICMYLHVFAWNSTKCGKKGKYGRQVA